ncbi:MAG: DUF2142 domain-containing protein [Ruminococcaceae bacterium]|nr:DUF2142 domain-containing protein [Oscillospiraceae bacterium]
MIKDTLSENGEIVQKQTKRQANLFLILALLFGLLLILIEPPFVIPDENKHYLNVIRVSHGGIFADVQDGQSGAYITADEYAFLSAFDGKYVNNSETYNTDIAFEHLGAPADGEEVFFASGDVAINPTPYLLPGLAIALARVLSFFSLNAFGGYLIGKFVNLLFFALIVRWALLRTKYLRNTMFLLGLMPMTIFQAASVSYDAYVISAAFLLFAFLTKILTAEPDVRISLEDVVAICLAAALLIGVKIAYAPLLLVLFAIPIRRFGSWKRYIACIAAVGVIGGLFYGVPTLFNGMRLSGCETVLTDAQIAQNAYVSENPTILLSVIPHTLGVFFFYWLESFFGILGWLDTPFPVFFVVLFLLSLLFVALAELSSIRMLKVKPRILAWLGVTVFFVGTVYTMYVSWNPVLTGIVGGTIAYGGQGRYFIPIAPFVFLIAANPLVYRWKIKEATTAICERATPLISLTYLTLTVILVFIRYWM